MGKERGVVERMLGRIVWGGDVERYHTMKNIRTETVGHHSAMVAHIASIVTPANWTTVRQYTLLLAAVRHDLGEGSEVECSTAIGDVPSPTKRAHPEFKVALNALEEERCAAVGLAVPTLDVEQKHILKYADNLAGLIFATQELSLGHVGIRPVYYAYRGYIATMGELSGTERVLFDIVQNWWEEAARGALWHRGDTAYERQ